MNFITTVSRFRSMIATALFGAVASGFAVLPAVADSFDAPKVTVKYGDLNLSNPQGAGALYARIRAAAKSVCSQFDGPSIDPFMQRDACVNRAIFDAVATVNNPALSAAYGAKTGKKVATRLVSR